MYYLWTTSDNCSYHMSIIHLSQAQLLVFLKMLKSLNYISPSLLHKPSFHNLTHLLLWPSIFPSLQVWSYSLSSLTSCLTSPSTINCYFSFSTFNFSLLMLIFIHSAAILPLMIRRKMGHIVAVSSVQGKLAIPYR